MTHQNGSSWIHQLEPILIPVGRVLAPIVLRLFLAWYARRPVPRELTRRERVLAWAVAFAAAALIQTIHQDAQPKRPVAPLGR